VIVLYYRNLRELLAKDDASRRYFQLLSFETQLSLHEQCDGIHTESDLRNTVNFLGSRRARQSNSGEM